MITKQCNDAYGYGCALVVEVEKEEDLKKYFYYKKTITGEYYQNTCKECVRKMHRKKYASGEYNWHKKHDNSVGYDKHYSIGVPDGGSNSER